MNATEYRTIQLRIWSKSVQNLPQCFCWHPLCWHFSFLSIPTQQMIHAIVTQSKVQLSKLRPGLWCIVEGSFWNIASTIALFGTTAIMWCEINFRHVKLWIYPKMCIYSSDVTWFGCDGTFCGIQNLDDRPCGGAQFVWQKTKKLTRNFKNGEWALSTCGTNRWIHNFFSSKVTIFQSIPPLDNNSLINVLENNGFRNILRKGHFFSFEYKKKTHSSFWCWKDSGEKRKAIQFIKKHAQKN